MVQKQFKKYFNVFVVGLFVSITYLFLVLFFDTEHFDWETLFFDIRHPIIAVTLLVIAVITDLFKSRRDPGKKKINN